MGELKYAVLLSLLRMRLNHAASFSFLNAGVHECVPTNQGGLNSLDHEILQHNNIALLPSTYVQCVLFVRRCVKLN